jgi:hypothetical protein
MEIALITFYGVLLVTLVLLSIWVGSKGRRSRLHNGDQFQLTSAAKHFAADMDSRARQNGDRWQAPGQKASRR